LLPKAGAFIMGLVHRNLSASSLICLDSDYEIPMPLSVSLAPSADAAANAAAHAAARVTTAQERFMRIREVCSVCGLSRASIYLRIKSGDFPAAVALDENSVAWVASEINQWRQTRIASRNH
jgi:prophage regulatory protein